MLTDRIAHALALAVEAHDGQKRKGTSIPYISHPMGVASIALEHGADEDQAMAALLHDAVEDGGFEYAQRIREQFGDRVADIVQGCTDGVPDAIRLNLCVAIPSPYPTDEKEPARRLLGSMRIRS
jgi:(p)ppGpp synthase/HD superfamily hydrolase